MFGKGLVCFLRVDLSEFFYFKGTYTLNNDPPGVFNLGEKKKKNMVLVIVNRLM